MSALDDLRLGARFAVNGGREGWIRTILTAIGVGCGVALLLVTSAIPNALAARDQRDNARGEFVGEQSLDKPGRDTLLIGTVWSDYHDLSVRGRVLRPEGPGAPVPPGLSVLPKPGELAVSPALKELLDSPEGDLLKKRLNGPVTAVIGDQGLAGPNELAYYQGSDTLVRDEASRINRFQGFPQEGLDPILMLLVLVAFVVLLIPVAVLIAAAVRFGGERRDRRLAALRLVGADGRMTRWVAAGEALVGALFGLVVGAGLFFAARSMAGLITLERISVFPSDLAPAPALVVLVCLAVPAAAVLVTLLAMRGVVVEPLGVVRTAKPVRRRVWWRVLLPVAGLALLLPQIRRGDGGGHFDQNFVVLGTAMLLIGVTVLLPWVVEAVVTRLGKGPVSFQLAVRRLQLSSGTAARAANGIAVAVAGAIALQMLLSGTGEHYTRDNGASESEMQVAVHAASPAAPGADQLRKDLAAITGVEKTFAYARTGLGDSPSGGEHYADVTVADCTALRELVELTSCKDGDVFLAAGKDLKGFTPGHAYFLDPAMPGEPESRLSWTLPAGAPTVPLKPAVGRYPVNGVFATPSAMPAAVKPSYDHRFTLKLDLGVPNVVEHVRNTAYAADPMVQAMGMTDGQTDHRYVQIRRGVLAGAACVLLLIGASLLISQLEQLRERRKLLAALVAFGTKRSTLGWSVLWQTALPVGLGLLLAVAIGYGLGAVLLLMTGFRVGVDWRAIASMSGLGAGVVLLVSLLSMPALWRLMRPDGLRTE
ncbi:membrane protein [Streptomyces spiroverticillatus]|uniref:Membrane protein n=1 Tax=Streptomyces finlayi TaxID=67296 RepID=A0A918WSA2_9ACTN|nr:ABC transporter permease [Streptomyces finlayi]GGZ86373.1 membrane protein [Streptomyces spiroverticillatus]GHC77905.1 membrane protein [Streptomyces finlayi]